MTTAHQARMGRIVLAGYERYEDEGTPESYMTTTSHDVMRETSIMGSYLELERAQRLRGITIMPNALGALIVVSPNVSLWALVRGFIKERGRARKAIKTPGSAL